MCVLVELWVTVIIFPLYTGQESIPLFCDYTVKEKRDNTFLVLCKTAQQWSSPCACKQFLEVPIRLGMAKCL